MNITFLHLGSNIGNRQQYLSEAIELISSSIGSIVSKSLIYETIAWGNTDQHDFLNQAISVNTDLSPLELLQTIHSIEKKLGRKRVIKWGPRVIDIDIIFYNSQIINTPELVIPHPYMAERKFVLEPLKDIAANVVHPISKKSVSEIYNESKDVTPISVHNN